MSSAKGVLARLFFRAGLTSGHRRRHDIRVHSLRKFFRTQLGALGTNPDYIEYMMGHKLSTYNDVESKGLEFLRGAYAASNLSIQEREGASTTEVLRALIRARGEDPSRYLKAKEVPIMDERIQEDEAQGFAGMSPDLWNRITGKRAEENEAQYLARALWDRLIEDVRDSLNAPPGDNTSF